MAQLTSIARYPVKGLTADYLQDVTLDKDQWLPFDRAWAIENGVGLGLKKKHYFALYLQSDMSKLKCRFNAETTEMTLVLGQGDPVTCKLDDQSTHTPMIQLLTDLLGERIRGELQIAHMPEQHFTDVPEPQSSIINAASVRELAQRLGREIDPARFRSNFVIDGIEPWSELDWVGREFQIGGIVFRGESRTDRCSATSINLDTDEIDIDMPKTLFEQYGHTDMGIYASIISGGRAACGDPVKLIG